MSATKTRTADCPDCIGTGESFPCVTCKRCKGTGVIDLIREAETAVAAAAIIVADSHMHRLTETGERQAIVKWNPMQSLVRAVIELRKAAEGVPQ